MMYVALLFVLLCTLSLAFRSHDGVMRSRRSKLSLSSSADCDILVRALRGESVSRTPVWLMRQAGRYLKEFRSFSEKYSFRERSETPDIALELSLQPWRKFGVDDILTPLPAMGIDFTMVESKGPKILNPIENLNDIKKMKIIEDPNEKLPFVGKILRTLRNEVEGKTTLIGFIGAPWTLAAYAVEGSQTKHCTTFKRMCNEEPITAHLLLEKVCKSLENYAAYQIESGAQVIQIFDSWAHHMTEEQFVLFAKPYVNRITKVLKAKFPSVPVIYFANGGSAFLHQQTDLCVDALSIDWHIAMKQARNIAGREKVLQGNVDPVVLYGNEQGIRKAVTDCIISGNTAVEGSKLGRGLILNLGHGVEKDTPEEAVAIFVDEARKTLLGH